MSDLSDLMRTHPSDLDSPAEGGGTKLEALIAALRTQRGNFDLKGAPAKSAARANPKAEAAAKIDLNIEL